MEQRLFSGQETLRQEAMKREQHLSDLQDGFLGDYLQDRCVVFEGLDDTQRICDRLVVGGFPVPRMLLKG